MSESKFKRIIIIGYGQITGEVTKHVHDLSSDYDYSLEYIEHEVHSFNVVKSYCNDNNIPYFTIENKSELTDYLNSIDSKTLIISASNNYLIPASILDNEYVTAINFHNALLPEFPGRNAPSWVIYENKRETGITWHYVTSGVDSGDIIIQKKTAIEPDIKAYELAAVLMNIALDAFKECFLDVLLEQATVTPQPANPNRKMYYSKDVPGNGEFKIDDDWKYIYRLLRATDYAKYDIFPSVTTIINNKKVRVVRYKLIPKDKAKSDEGYLLYEADNDMMLQIKYKECAAE